MEFPLCKELHIVKFRTKLPINLNSLHLNITVVPPKTNHKTLTLISLYIFVDGSTSTQLANVQWLFSLDNAFIIYHKNEIG